MIDKRISQFSVPRSGSSLISTILKKIFKEVKHYHEYDGGVSVVIYRDFRDSLLSYYRVVNNIKDDFFITEKKEIDEIINNPRFIQPINDLHKYKKRKGILFLKYEDFFSNEKKNDFDFIFDRIENHFSINIPNEIKNDLIENHNIINNAKNIEMGINNNYTYGKIHINKGEVGLWKKYITPNLHDYYMERLKEHLKLWDYDIDK